MAETSLIAMLLIGLAILVVIVMGIVFTDP
jgi:hypothetical protein